MKNADKIQVKAIFEGANGPTTYAAEQIFQKKGIVAGAYESRKPGKIYILSLDGGEGVYGKQNSISMDGMGLVKAYRVATGFMMIQRKVFEDLRDAHPEWKHKDSLEGNDELYSFFDFKCTPKGYIGEDFLFCDRARAIGYEIWIDPTIKLGHMGVQEYEGDFGHDVLYPMINPIQGQKVA